VVDQWQPGNFDSAGANQFLGELIDDLCESIEEILDDDERFALDDDAEYILMPSVELIALLCERYNTKPPKVKKIQKWRKKYLKMYDAQIDALEPPGDYKAKRRQVIDKTFAWLESVATTHYA
jgi:hypothetical protein